MFGNGGGIGRHEIKKSFQIVDREGEKAHGRRYHTPHSLTQEHEP
jgi:hypothetical protein